MEKQLNQDFHTFLMNIRRTFLSSQLFPLRPSKLLLELGSEKGEDMSAAYALEYPGPKQTFCTINIVQTEKKDIKQNAPCLLPKLLHL